MHGLTKSSSQTARTVCIIQRRLTHYRVPLFEALREKLADRNIRLDLLVGKGTTAEEEKNDAGELPWAKPIPTHYLAGERLCWQSVQGHLGAADLVIVTQENKLILNHLLMLAPRRFKLAFWGHGANLQSGNPRGLKERFKRWTTNRVDWWFAYTQMSADLVMAAGFPGDHITVLNNAVDTFELRQQRQSVTIEETRALRESLGFGSGPVGVFVGSLYTDKRLDFLFAAAEAIRGEVPEFHLLIVGEGPERDKVQAWCAMHPWARWVGARFGREKAAYLSVAQVMLNPGLVGLGILDAFVSGVPMLTTDCGIHSPEIVYLENGVNGVMTADDLDAYVQATVHLLSDMQALDALRTGCRDSAKEFTVENMARRFADGVVRAVAA
ncbi:MAG: glycosyltransferase family 4 protein [Gammaproteobacteria bacterium]|nr:glycosyltransferase family 4 protein [Gammaproteobacteria bacterium]MBU1481742.1 glycosyltransferase family 4 protein [Gammaproteobacteria bacterium]